MTNTQKQNILDLMSQLPSVLRNNERTYWRKKIEKFYENPVEWRARELEDRFEGLSIDLPDYASEERGQPIN